MPIELLSFTETKHYYKKRSNLLLRINNAIDKLVRAHFLSAMDLISRYWQFNLPEEDQEKCTLIAQSGLYQPTQMSQELSNTLSTFQE